VTLFATAFIDIQTQQHVPRLNEFKSQGLIILIFF